MKLLTIAMLFAGIATAEPEFQQRVILDHGSAPGAYAIPKLVITPQGTAIIVAQDRQGGDWGKPISPFVMRSTDNGETWSTPASLIPADFPNQEELIIKPTGIIVDAIKNRIQVFVSAAPVNLPDGKPLMERWFYRHIQETRSLGRTWYLVTSADDGQTWTKPKPIIDQLINKPHWQEWSPVHSGIQLRNGPHKGRLVVPVRCYCPEEDPSTLNWRFQTNSAVFSDDGGATWELGARTGEFLGECSITERPDGSIYMNQRASPGNGRASERWYTVSHDGGATFEPTRSTGLPDVLCHVGLTNTTTADGNPIMIMSGIPGDKREKLTISTSSDGGVTWTPRRILESGLTAYSDLVMLPNGDILCVYETGDKESRKDLAVARFNLEWLFRKIH
jgi:sialidase-1